MNALLYLIPAALFLGLLGLAGFFWAMRRGQFDDLDGAAHRILLDDKGRPLPHRRPPQGWCPQKPPAISSRESR